MGGRYLEILREGEGAPRGSSIGGTLGCIPPLNPINPKP